MPFTSKACASTGDGNNLISITGSDTTAGFLAAKLVAGTGIALNVLGGGGSETLEIVNVGAMATPGAPLNSVQFNVAGAFTGSANLLFNGTTLSMPHNGLQLTMGSGAELQFFHNGTDSIIDATSGQLILSHTSGNLLTASTISTAVLRHQTNIAESTSNTIQHQDYLRIAGTGTPVEASRITTGFSNVTAGNNTATWGLDIRLNTGLIKALSFTTTRAIIHLGNDGTSSTFQVKNASGSERLSIDGEGNFVNTCSAIDALNFHVNDTPNSISNTVRKSDFLNKDNGAGGDTPVEASRIETAFNADLGNLTNKTQINFRARRANTLFATFSIRGSDKIIFAGDVTDNVGLCGITLAQNSPTLLNYALLSDGDDLFINTRSTKRIAFREGNVDKFIIQPAGANQDFEFINSIAASTSNVIQHSALLNITGTTAAEATVIESQFTDIGASTNDSTLTFYTVVNDVLAARVRIDSDGILKTAAGDVYLTSASDRTRAATAVSSNTGAMGVADFYAVTDTTAVRTITVTKTDIVDGRTFIFNDESRGAATNNITIATDIESVTTVAAFAGGGTVFTSANHGFVVGTVVFHDTFIEPTYNGTFVVTTIESSTEYVIAAITFTSDDTGNAHRTIDGLKEVKITANSGVVKIYSDNLQNLHSW